MKHEAIIVNKPNLFGVPDKKTFIELEAGHGNSLVSLLRLHPPPVSVPIYDKFKLPRDHGQPRDGLWPHLGEVAHILLPGGQGHCHSALELTLLLGPLSWSAMAGKLPSTIFIMKIATVHFWYG